MADRTAVIVGGGIGGLSAAVALRRRGWPVTVLERAPEPGEVGAGLVLMANAIRGLDTLGLGRAIRDHGQVEAPAGTRTSSGRWLSRVDGADLTRTLGTAAVGIHRATLHRLLREALPPDALVTGAEVVDVSPGPPAEVSYRHHGTPVTVPADLVVGADGLRSVVRARLWPDTPPPVYSGSAAWRGVTGQRWDGELVVAFSWGPGAEFGIVPLGDGPVYWYAAVNSPPGRSYPDHLAAVRERFGGWHAPISDLLAATPPEAVLYHDLYHLGTPLPRYVKGRVALLGDAAHAMPPNLGQGACQAIEDAVVLGALCGTRADLPAALAAYDAQRRPRTQQVARAARAVERIGQQLENRVAVAVRNTAMRLTPARIALRSMARYADWQPPAVPADTAGEADPRS